MPEHTPPVPSVNDSPSAPIKLEREVIHTQGGLHSISGHPLETMDTNSIGLQGNLRTMQQGAGNLATSNFVHQQLKISKHGDPLEIEATQVAEQVMAIKETSYTLQELTGRRKYLRNETNLQIFPSQQSSGSPIDIFRSEDTHQNSSSKEKTNAKSHIQKDIGSLEGKGKPLPDSTREFMEPRFGKDLSQVRVHTGNNAEKLSTSINARAFTVGRNIAFGQGQFSPETNQGKKLIAHELAHVVQQADRNIEEIQRYDPGPPVTIDYPDPYEGTPPKKKPKKFLEAEEYVAQYQQEIKTTVLQQIQGLQKQISLKSPFASWGGPLLQLEQLFKTKSSSLFH